MITLKHRNLRKVLTEALKCKMHYFTRTSWMGHSNSWEFFGTDLNPIQWQIEDGNMVDCSSRKPKAVASFSGLGWAYSRLIPCTWSNMYTPHIVIGHKKVFLSRPKEWAFGSECLNEFQPPQWNFVGSHKILSLQDSTRL